MPKTPPHNPYKVFHSPLEKLRCRVHIVLDQPEHGGNVGSVARAMANMGILGELRIVKSPHVVDELARKMAVHAQPILEAARYFDSFEEAINLGANPLRIASTADAGSSSRPHPLRVEEAALRSVEKLSAGDYQDIVLIFGSESNGLTNPQISACDWIATIPSVNAYRSLNLAQAVLIFAYEVNRALLKDWEAFRPGKPGQKERLIGHLLELAERVGFVLPGDPYKMRPRLETIFQRLPRYIEDGNTLHGLIDQVMRSVRLGAPDIRGRYKSALKGARKRGDNA